jgi:hypothetical protein
MAVGEDLLWLVRDCHDAKIRSGFYRNMVAQATRLGFDQKAHTAIAKQVGCTPGVLDALLTGGIEPTVAQYRQLNEALRTAVAPEPAAVNGSHG